MALTDTFVKNVKHTGAVYGDKYTDEGWNSNLSRAKKYTLPIMMNELRAFMRGPHLKAS